MYVYWTFYGLDRTIIQYVSEGSKRNISDIVLLSGTLTDGSSLDEPLHASLPPVLLWTVLTANTIRISILNVLTLEKKNNT